MKNLFILFFCFCLASCATNLEQGYKHYQKQEYDQAAYYWNPLAKQGNPYAQYNIGLLWEYGLGSTTQNKAQAAEWYLLSAKQGYPTAMVKLAEYQFSIGSQTPALSWLNMAARWGDETAIGKLRSMGEAIPRSDLLAQQIAANQKKQKDNEDLAVGLIAIGAIVAAVASGSNSGKSNPTYYPSTNSSTIPENTYTPPIKYKIDNSCSSDYSCGIGFSCVKKPFSSSGVCLKTVNSYGTPTYNMPDLNSIGIKTEGSCLFNTDCPIGFRCNSNLKACVK